MDSPTMEMLSPKPAAGTFGAHSFKTVYAKQKLAANIIKTLQWKDSEVELMLSAGSHDILWSTCSWQSHPVSSAG